MFITFSKKIKKSFAYVPSLMILREKNRIYFNKLVQGTLFEIQSIHAYHYTWIKKERRQFLEKEDKHSIIMWSKKDRTEKYWSIETYLYTKVTYTVYIGTYYIAWGTMKIDIKSTQSQTLQSITKHIMTFDIGKHTLHAIS